MVKQLNTVSKSIVIAMLLVECTYYMPIKFETEKKIVILPKVYIVSQSKCLKAKILIETQYLNRNAMSV